MKKVLIALSAVVLLASCKKDKVDVTEANLIGNYKTQSIMIGSFDAWSMADPCNKDDIHMLKAGGIYEYDDAGTQCSPPEDYTSTWDLISSTQIEIDGETATIKEFDGTTLVVEGVDPDTGAMATITFKKQ